MARLWELMVVCKDSVAAEHRPLTDEVVRSIFVEQQGAYQLYV